MGESKGDAFDGGENTSGIAAVKVRHGACIDSIQLIYRNGSDGQHYGGWGGGEDVFKVDIGDAITGFEVWSGAVVGGFGGGHDTYTAPGGHELVGISGVAGSLVDSI